MLLGGKRFILKWYVLTLFRYQFCVIGKWSASVILVDFSSKVGTGSMIPTDLSRKIMVRICFTGASLDKIAKVDSLDFESSFRELDPSSLFLGSLPTSGYHSIVSNTSISKKRI